MNEWSNEWMSDCMNEWKNSSYFSKFAAIADTNKQHKDVKFHFASITFFTSKMPLGTICIHFSMLKESPIKNKEHKS